MLSSAVGPVQLPSRLAHPAVLWALKAVLRHAPPCSVLGEQRQMWHLHFSVCAVPSDRFVWTVLFIIQHSCIITLLPGAGKRQHECEGLERAGLVMSLGKLA